MRFLFVLLVFVLSLTTIIADNPVSVDLFEGKNVVVIDEYFPSFYVNQLIFDYPEIDSVTLDEFGQSYGFIRAFGGVGTNFLVQSGGSYEVVVSSNVTISFYS